MGKRKDKKKSNDMKKIMAQAFDQMINEALFDIRPPKSKQTVQQKKLPGQKVKFPIEMKMYMDRQKKKWNFTDLIEFIQNEEPGSIARTLKRIDSVYTFLAGKEKASNNDTASSLGLDKVPEDLYVLQKLLTTIEAIKEVS
jgi:hypothetical protein